MTICICAWQDVEHHVTKLSAGHVISLLGVEGRAETPPGIAPENHLNLDIDDIDYEHAGYKSPQPGEIAQIIEFGTAWGASGALVVHCFAGISRSSAAAMTLLCLHNPGREQELADLLRAQSAHVRPNPLMIEFADELLNCQGRLVDAVASMSPPEFTIPAPATIIPAKLL